MSASNDIPPRREPIDKAPHLTEAEAERKGYNAMGSAAEAQGARKPFTAMGQAHNDQESTAQSQTQVQRSEDAGHGTAILPDSDAEHLQKEGSAAIGGIPRSILTPPAIIAPPVHNLRPGWRALPSEQLPAPTYFPVVMALAIALLAWGPVTTWIISAIGLALFVIALGGWIGEMRRGH